MIITKLTLVSLVENQIKASSAIQKDTIFFYNFSIFYDWMKLKTYFSSIKKKRYC